MSRREKSPRSFARGEGQRFGIKAGPSASLRTGKFPEFEYIHPALAGAVLLISYGTSLPYGIPPDVRFGRAAAAMRLPASSAAAVTASSRASPAVRLSQRPSADCQ